VITVFRTEAARIKTTIESLRHVLTLEHNETRPLLAEIDQVILPQLEQFQRELEHTANEWSEMVRRVQQIEPLLAGLARRLETHVSASAQQIADQSEQAVAALLAQFKAKNAPAKQENNDDTPAE
ncbi:MAG: hypothetical protein HY866_21895, partial [Chloroflexi bacterium]|nr:hypothetical protein [Chloroflexota bacterium]